MTGQRIIDIEVPCPMSGMRGDGKIVALHKLKVWICRGDRTLTAYCRVHNSRIFICDESFVTKALEDYNGSTQTDQPAARRAPAK